MGNAGLYLALSIRIPHPARQRDSSVMRQHVLIKRIERRIVNIRSEDSFAQVVEHHDPGDPAEAAKSFLMQLGPGLRTGAEHQQPDTFAAEAQGQHEQPGTLVLAGVRIAHHRPFAVIDLRFFTGRCFDDGSRLR